jgi:hypothetical protein
VFLSDNLVSWSFERQNIIPCLSAETEYHIVANGVTEACWLCQLLVELHSPLSRATLVYFDNVNTVYFTNSVQHTCIKHIEIDFHFVLRLLSSPTSSPRGYPPRCSQVAVQSQHLKCLEFRLWGVLSL